MTEYLNPASEVALQSSKSRFEGLQLRGLKQFDPLSYDLCDRFLEKVAESLESGNRSRANKFLARLEQCLAQMEGKLEKCASVAQEQVDIIKQAYRSEFSQAASFKQNYQYDELNGLYQRLTSRSDEARVFVELKTYLEKHDWSQVSQEVIGLDALLYDLEDMDSSQDHPKKGLKPLKAASEGSDQLEELKSLQNYREYLGRVVTENMVRQVIKEDPENAGPLNPQRLLVRTLSTMKDLSPSYVNRLVPYFDSLMTLDEMSKA